MDLFKKGYTACKMMQSYITIKNDKYIIFGRMRVGTSIYQKDNIKIILQ